MIYRWLLLFLLLPSLVFGAVTADGTPHSDAQDIVGSIAVTHAVGGGCTNPALYADVIWYDNSSIGITSVNSSGTGGGAMTQIGEVINGSGGGPTTFTMRTYRRTGTTGSQTVTVTFSGGNATYAGLVVSSFCGVHQSTPEGPGGVATNYGSTNATIVDVTAASGLYVRAVVATPGAVSVITPDGSQTNIYTFNGDFGAMSLSSKAGAGTTSMLSGLDDFWYWVAIGVPINPAAATVAVRHKPIIQ